MKRFIHSVVILLLMTSCTSIGLYDSRVFSKNRPDLQDNTFEMNKPTDNSDTPLQSGDTERIQSPETLQTDQDIGLDRPPGGTLTNQSGKKSSTTEIHIKTDSSIDTLPIDSPQKPRHPLLVKIQQFESHFSAEAGMIVRRFNDNSTLFQSHANRCFIPASLTKFILETALIRALLADNQVAEDSFQKKKAITNWNHPSFNAGLEDLLRTMNTYTFADAQQANETADATGQFLQAIELENGSSKTIQMILADHIRVISKPVKCNHIEKVSGLSVNNRLNLSQIADCMFFLKDFDFFIRSLPTPGQGTLTDRLLDLEMDNRFKTGSLRQSGVICLAGYLKRRTSSDDIFFVIILNKVKSSQFDKAVAWIDETVRFLYFHLDSNLQD